MLLLRPGLGALLCLASAPLATAATITLDNGDRLQGEILAESETTVRLSHPTLGELSLPRSAIASIERDGEVAVTALDEGETEGASTDDGLLGTGWLTGWKRLLDVGITGAEGKSDNMKINAGFSADYEDEATRWAHKTAYYRNEADGDLSDNSFYSLLNRDWLRPGSPWFQFAGGRFDWDEFKDWDYRLGLNGGVGYEFVNTDSWRLLGRTGIGGNQTFGGSREEFTPELLLGIQVDWKISEREALHFTNTLYPNLTDTGEFRNLTSLDWMLDLDQALGLGLKFSLTNEYDSLTEDGIDKNDFKYTGSLVWKL